MKLKQSPEDFQVEELTDIAPVREGPFAFYRLEKRGWTTHDALDALGRRWKIEPRRISYGGLKDRHAQTTQYVTIYHGPPRDLKHHEVSVRYLGQVTRPFTSKDIRANRFRITLRGLRSEEIPAVRQALDEICSNGVPNYFDDQRFGSVGEGNCFVARSLVLGHYEEALRLALAEPYQYDRAAQKREKEILLAHWRDWQTCKALLPRSHARSIVDYLVSHPVDFRGAVARLRPELRSLYLAAYQSYLWNRILALALQHYCRPDQLVQVGLRLGKVPMQRALDDEQRTQLTRLSLPLPSARLHFDPSDPRIPFVDAVMAEEGLALKELKIKAFREPFFSKGERSAACLPEGLKSESHTDDGHPGSQKLILCFDLPRGSYATLIVKRIQQAAAMSAAPHQTPPAADPDAAHSL